MKIPWLFIWAYYNLEVNSTSGYLSFKPSFCKSISNRNSGSPFLSFTNKLREDDILGSNWSGLNPACYDYQSMKLYFWIIFVLHSKEKTSNCIGLTAPRYNHQLHNHDKAELHLLEPVVHPLWKDFCFITFLAVTRIKISGVNCGKADKQSFLTSVKCWITNLKVTCVIYKPTISPATASETWTRSLDINSVALFNLTGFQF